YLARAALEKQPKAVADWLDVAEAGETAAPLSARAFAAVALGGPECARRLAALLPELGRSPTSEELLLIASAPDDPAAQRILKSTQVDLFKSLAASGRSELQREAVLALAAAKSEAAVPALLELWPSLNSALRRVVVDRLAGSAASARQLVAAVGSGAVSRDELDGYTLDKLSTVLPDDAGVKQLVAELGNFLKPVLR